MAVHHLLESQVDADLSFVLKLKIKEHNHDKNDMKMHTCRCLGVFDFMTLALPITASYEWRRPSLLLLPFVRQVFVVMKWLMNLINYDVTTLGYKGRRCARNVTRIPCWWELTSSKQTLSRDRWLCQPHHESPFSCTCIYMSYAQEYAYMHVHDVPFCFFSFSATSNSLLLTALSFLASSTSLSSSILSLLSTSLTLLASCSSLCLRFLSLVINSSLAIKK